MGSNGTEIYTLRQTTSLQSCSKPLLRLAASLHKGSFAQREPPHGFPRPYALQNSIALAVSIAIGLCNRRAREIADFLELSRVG
jgi:hypothetical protein